MDQRTWCPKKRAAAYAHRPFTLSYMRRIRPTATKFQLLDNCCRMSAESERNLLPDGSHTPKISSVSVLGRVGPAVRHSLTWRPNACNAHHNSRHHDHHQENIRAAVWALLTHGAPMWVNTAGHYCHSNVKHISVSVLDIGMTVRQCAVSSKENEEDDSTLKMKRPWPHKDREIRED